MTEYDAADNSRKCFDEAIRAMREQRVRAGLYAPRTGDETELRWASEGPRQRLTAMALMATRDAQKEKAPRTGCSEGPQTMPRDWYVENILNLDQCDTNCKPRTAPDTAHAYKSPALVCPFEQAACIRAEERRDGFWT